MVYVTQQTSYLTSFFFAMVTSSTSVSMLFQSTLPQVWTWGISKQEETLVAPLRLRSLSKNHDFSFCCLDLSIVPSFTNFLKVRHVLYKKKNKNKTKEKSKSIQQTTKSVKKTCEHTRQGPRLHIACTLT